ncbi:transposase [Eleftheria terrae]|uniref:transposase n=1 Tax=Eleftheria terrae TaxID=1597781 RepID=UPI003F4DA96F
MARHLHELPDAEWAVLEPLLPPNRTAGRPYGEHRRMLNAMLFLFGCDRPERSGR